MPLRISAVIAVIAAAFATGAYGQTARDKGRKSVFSKSSSSARSSQRDVLFIFDSSASMSKKTLNGARKIDVAKEAFTRMVNRLPDNASGVKVGLMAYGHRIQAGRSGCCGDIELVVPVTPTNKRLLTATVKSFRPLGKTPIAKSLALAAQALRALNSDRQKMVVLLTDGIETCGGNPEQAAAALQQLGIDVDFYVIGFDLPEKQVRVIKAIAAAGKGTFLNANNKKKLDEAFEIVENKIKAPNKPAAAAYFFDNFNGTKLADHWQVINPDADSYIVENGNLLAVTSATASLAKGNVPNLFRLKKALPQGDWTMTVQLRANMQTASETIVFGLHQDKDNFILAEASFGHTGYAHNSYLQIAGVKTSKGKTSRVNTTAWSGRGSRIIESMKTFPQPLLLRLEKRGRTYTILFGFETFDKKNKKKQMRWTTVGKLTSLRARGQLVLGLFQRSKVTGESSINVDWVKIERAE